MPDTTLSNEAGMRTEKVPGTPEHDKSQPWWHLGYLPVGLFGAVMGLTGLSVAWRIAHLHYNAPGWISLAIGDVAMGAFVLITAGYVLKLITAPEAVRTEFEHPIAGNLFGTLLISLLLLPIVVTTISQRAASLMWIVGAVGMVAFGWLIVTRWITNRQVPAHATPTWIVPVVGMLDIPLALPSLDLPTMPFVMVFGLAVGLFFALPLFTLIFSRLIFETPMPDGLQPTLLIVSAPFSVGFLTYVTKTGQVDLFAESLYALMLFMLAILLPRLRFLRRACPFRVSWWATSFPLAAAAVAALRFADANPGWLADLMALALLGFSTLLIAYLMARTLLGILRGELRTLSS